MLVIQYPQDEHGERIKKQIVALENTAWTPSESGGDTSFPSSPHTYVTSFVLFERDRAVSHVAVRKSLLFHKGCKYLAYGLSEVVTHPDYQRMGLGLQLIQKAANFILSQATDISIFTCAPHLVEFYAKGGWETAHGACFVGGTQAVPFRSDSLGLTTMIRFISDKAQFHKQDFANTDLIFELGENQLW